MTGPVSCALGLRCIDCRREEPLAYRLACPGCGGLLEPVYDLEPLRRAGPGAAFTGRGVWRYHPVLPIRDRAHFVSLGEGGTPLLDAPALARVLGVRRLLLKFEGTNPTGTIKDRSSATAVAAALQFGYRAISVVSTGNAGSSLAAYATRAGLRALIFCYEQAAAPKLANLSLVASDLILYRGFYDDLIRLWDRMLAEQPVFDGGASRNVFKQEGKKTLAWEIAEDCGYRLPDVVVYPVAVGEAFISGWRAFDEMRALGWIREPSAPGGRAIGPGESHRRRRGGRARISGRSPSPTPSPRGSRSATPARRARGCCASSGRGRASRPTSRTRPSWTRSASWRAPRGSTRGRPGSRRSPPRAGSWPRAPSTRPARSAA